MDKTICHEFRSMITCALKLLALFFLLWFPAVGQAQYNYSITYNSDQTSGTATIIPGYSGPGGAIIIPDVVSVGGIICPVVSIGVDAFHGCSTLTSVTIIDNVTNVGSGAFEACFHLTNVTILNSVITIDEEAFFLCYRLTSVTLGNNVSSIGTNAFLDCSSLNNVTIPNSVTNIGDGAFLGCTNLTSITLSTNITDVGNYEFEECEDLNNVTIPNSVVSIGEEAFGQCYSLNRLTIGTNVTDIGISAFSDCIGLTNITIPNSVTNIEDEAFLGCTNLTGIYFNGNAPIVGAGVFTNDPAIAYYLPGTIGWGSTFAGIPAELLNPPFVCTTTNGAITIIKYTGTNSVVNIPDTINGQPVTSIGNMAFQNCASLSQITIGTNVTSIGSSAFYFCRNLISVTIPNNVTSIGFGAFEDCHSLASIAIPNSVTNIGDYAFADCYGLDSVTIGNGVVSIGNASFASCIKLSGVLFWGNAPSVLLTTFSGDKNTIAYFLPGTTGWDDFSTNSRVQAVLVAPSIQITAPTADLQVSNSSCFISGTASNSFSITISNVCYSLNNATWTNAMTTNNWSNWTAFVGLIAGTNVIQAYAVDTIGNISATNSVNIIAVLSTALTVNTNGSGTVSPNYNGVPLQILATYSMTATAGAGCLFTNWTGRISSPLAVLTNGPTLQFVMQSNLVLQANFLDIQKPTNSIISPTPRQLWSNNVFTVTGKASDNVAVATVFYSVNNAAWTNATTANNWSNWTATANLISGTNNIQAYAVDTSGNVSATNSVKIIAILGTPLQVRIAGKGTLSPNYSNAVLQIGNIYKMTAKAAKGFAFRNWTVSTNWIGGTITNNATVQFTMASNLTLQATFADVTAPVVKIIKPAKPTVSNITVNGTASDNVQVTNVLYSLNGSSWTSAASGNQFVNWSVGLNLVPGANNLSVYAVDSTGNVSKTAKLSLQLNASQAAVVKIAGTVNANTLAITDWAYATNGFNFTLQGSSSQNGRIQVSTNLNNWETLTNFTGTNAPLNFRDPAATNASQRFYRAVSP